MPEVTYIGYAELTAKAMAAVEQAVTLSAEDLVAAQMADAPVKTGTLRAGIHIDSIETSADSVTAITATGGESSSYAIPVHEGTREHVIEGKDGGYLNWPGAEHPVKRVIHPATVGNPYMTRPLLAGAPVYAEAMARAAAEEF